MGSAERFRAVALAALITSGSAIAQPPAAVSPAARELFDQGRKLLAAKDYVGACTKFEESQRIDPGGGTLLNLALCNELQGKTATAWTLFDEALRWARRDGRPDREHFAREHLDALRPRLARLVVVVETGARVPALTVMRDGVTLGAASLGAALPVDPGNHVIEARAPGKRPFRTEISVREGAVGTVTITALEDLQPRQLEPPAPEHPVASPGQAADSARTWGTLLIGAGASVAVVGALFGLRALDHRGEANAICPERECPSRMAVALNDDAQASASISLLLIAGGLGVAGVGTLLVLKLPSERRVGFVALEGSF